MISKAGVIVFGIVSLSFSAAFAQPPQGGETAAPTLSFEELASLEPAVDTANLSPRGDAPQGSAPTSVASSRVVDSLDLGTTSITGNQELPKVLYIVPWKQADLGDLVGRPVNTLLDEVLAPVDPEVFERQLGYYEALHAKDEEE
jgi:hypothetical protein